MSVSPGWYPDPADPGTQRYWDGEQWVGGPVPADEEPPAVPPPSIEVSRIPALLEQAAEPEPAVTAAPAPVPSRMPGGLPLAPLVHRLAARLIDICVVTALAIIVNSYFFVSFYQELYPQLAAITKALSTGATPPELTHTERSTRLLVVMTITAIALWFAYEVPGTANTGQTLGKRLLGIKTERLDGAELTFWQASRRWLVMAIPFMMLGIYGLPIQMVDCGWCLRDKRLRQCWHDMGAQAVVVLARPARLAGGPGPASPIDPAGPGAA